MNKKLGIGIIAIVGALLVMFTGCVAHEEAPMSMSMSTPTLSLTPEPILPPSAQPKYSPGDIIATEPTEEFLFEIVISYDERTDSYEHAYIYRNLDGSWNRPADYLNYRSIREALEDDYPSLITKVNLLTIPSPSPPISPLAEPKYSPGDIIAADPKEEWFFEIIISYDELAGMYELDYIWQLDDGSWERYEGYTYWEWRDYVEETSPYRIANIDISSVPIVHIPEFYEPPSEPIPTLLWIAIIPALIALILVLLLRSRASVKFKMREQIDRLTIISNKLKKRIFELEAGKNTKAMDKDSLNRLSKIEETIEPLKESPKLSSLEYNLLQYQINKLNADREDSQNRLERMIEQNFDSFRSVYSLWMAIIAILFTLAIAILIYLLPEQPDQADQVKLILELLKGTKGLSNVSSS